MADLLLFTPKHQRDSQKNLDDFIAMCRDRLTVFGADLDWYANAWPKVGNFTVMGAPARGYTTDQLLNADIIPFAKAYVRYQQGHTPTKLKNEFKAIRCIEKALLTVKGKADITQVDQLVMDAAGQVAREYEATSYQAGVSLVKLMGFLNESRIVPDSITWRNPIRKPKEIDRTDAEGKRKRAEKLPEDRWLEAMAEMFANDLVSARDRFTTSVFALLMCAPSRISEVQDLPVNCLHPDTDGEGVERLGLRFYAGKGYGADIKWIPTIFKDIATEAVRRLTELSAPGRALAKWYEDHPDRFYRHEDCPHVPDNQPLTDEQACMAIGIKAMKGALDSFFSKYKPYGALKKKGESLTLAFLNDYCHSQLPVGWPWRNRDRNIKYSEALCCFRAHELRSDFSPSPIRIWGPGKSTFTTDLNFIDGQERSIWKRHGYKNPDGSEISMTSHQVRHFLNTVAQRGALGQLDIAKWSGRANIHQNAVYNHMSDDEYVELARNAGVGGILDKIQASMPVTYADLETVGDGIAHVTEYGFCVHDYSMLPCQKHRDCLNCTEQVCVKGDVTKLDRLRQQRSLTHMQLEKAEAADTSGTYGADRWSQHQIKTLERLDQLIQILESPDLPDGTAIRLSNDQEYTPLKRELAARQSYRRLPSSEPGIDELRNLLGVF
ncbi:integrase [Pseudomonas mosselii]|uniref:Integrase n=1 Tax=Pseudomonas mosselii TaxID=78327 RepID=A0ABX9B2L4_9PSED|nr:integrase [Pseudomonas mosselii]QZP26315.1 integrase [Pseudomonas mosselii]